MKRDTPRKMWGAGRVIFMARLDTIRSEIVQGHPMTVIFGRHQAVLGIGYRSFCRLVERYAADAKLTPGFAGGRGRTQGTAASEQRTAETSATTTKPLSLPSKGPVDARYESRPRTFEYDGAPRQDDKSRLVGEPRQSFKR